MRRPLPWIVALALGIVLAVVLRDHFHLRAHLAFADDQTATFETIRDQAAQSAEADISALEYVWWYYPSGTKQVPGSTLDLIVERARRNASREIIAILKAKSGKDFGDDPNDWIEGMRALAPR